MADGNSLKHFAGTDIKISAEQAVRILRFFFPDLPVDRAAVTPDDIGFAQALLLEAVDASTDMSYVRVIFDKAFMKAPTDYSFVKDIAKALCKQALKNWFRHATQKDLDDPQIYEAVRGTMTRSFRSVWAIRIQTGELTY